MDTQLAMLDSSPIRFQRSEASFGFNSMHKGPSGIKLAPLKPAEKAYKTGTHQAHALGADRSGDKAKETPLTPEMRISLILEKKGYKPAESSLPKKLNEVIAG